MATQSVDPQQGTPEQQQLLLVTPGPRLGWTFRDRRSLRAPFPQPPPNFEGIRWEVAHRVAAAQRSWQKTSYWPVPTLVAGPLLWFFLDRGHSIWLLFVVAVVIAGPLLAWSGWQAKQLRQAKASDPQRLYQVAYGQWAQQAAAWEQAELTRLAGVPEWGSAGTPAQRTDVFGGTLAGWQALLTVHGASILAERPLLVADLSGQHAAIGLAALTGHAQIPAAEYVLPRDLDRSGLLARLTPAELATALAEAIHTGTPGGARADRAVDVRVLQQLCSAIADGGITPARLAAATEVALGRPDPSGLLTPDEADLIRGSLFGDTYKTQIVPNLVRLDAFLSELARHAGTGIPAAPDPGRCTIFTAEPVARSAQAELLAALIIEWITVQVTGHTATTPAIIIAAADDITRPHLERLAEACEHRGVPLTLLFRHLRDDAIGVIGSRATAFMRLGNHREAEQAASFIGRQHTFVLSGFTTTRGGEHTSTSGQSQSWGTSESRRHSLTEPWAGMFSREHSSTHTVATESSESHGTSWSQADTTQRVYEFAIEPTVLQNLPDNALLLIRRDNTVAQLQPVECDPEIVTLPGVSLTPLDYEQTPAAPLVTDTAGITNNQLPYSRPGTFGRA
jgi:hypothetical protein